MRFLPLVGFPFVTLFAVTAAPGAEKPASAPLTIEYYYKLVPGGAKEWLALYKKNHNPILQELMKAGILKSEKLHDRSFQTISPAVDHTAA